MKIIVIAVIMVMFLAVLITRDVRKQRGSSGKKKVSGSLQEFLPIERFAEDGSVVVNKRFRRLIHVGDVNLYSMSVEEIQATRDRFKEMLQRLDNPFQISVQARRANYTDFVKYTESAVDDTMNAYKNPVFNEYAKGLKQYIKEEALKPRTARENIIVVGVVPRMGAESPEAQLERLDREHAYVEAGLSNMGVPFQTLEPVEVIEAAQNFWNRERAVTQRYRDALVRRSHAPKVSGSSMIGSEVKPNVGEA
ncbi:hypothetical protein [Alicyclobacillus sp. ALC3]|uniref:hypothetical protein n=1 Tax=Alicyclobacillus sp. ALC3 TaxID=2796143 RepID=UPI0023790B88|nr:hypothetical protein [Alicyclobacillus sp. ALC3]WDL99689.1 hypothetical protein JC200_23910 [Alicyclobacillus sp. ALC3]